MITINYAFIIVILNFILLLIILNKLLYKPIKKFLEERQAKIGSDIDDAELSKQEAENLMAEKEKELKQSTEEIRKMKQDSRREAEKQASEIIKEAKDKERKIIGETEDQLLQEKEKVILEIEGKLTQMVTDLSEKFLSHKLDKEQDVELLNKLIEESEAK
jgi:F-type H+-transporting ATPase subunit b